MKKHYSIIVSLLLVVMVLFGYSAMAQKYTKQQVIENKTDVSFDSQTLQKINNVPFHQNISKSIDSNAVILSQDFTGTTFPPTGWTATIVGGTATLNWTRGTSLVLSYNTLNPTGTTFATGYAWVNSDGYGSGTSPVENCALRTPAINCSGYTNVYLSFSEFFREYAASTATVEVSTNGTIWTTVYEPLPGVSVDSSTANPNFVDLNLTSYAAGQATFYVRWHWQGNWDYYWVIDDINLYTKPAYDIALSKFSNPNEYVVKPLAHYTSGPLTLAATAKNMGSSTVTNVAMDVNVYNLSTMALVHTATSNTIASLAPDASGLLTATTTYTPAADTSIYYMRYIVHMTQADADLSNDTLYSGFWISDSLFARSDEMFTSELDGALGFGTGTKGIMGNNFTLAVADKLSRIDAYVTGPAVNDSTQMFVYATDVNGMPTTQLGATAVFKCTSATAQWLSLPINGGPLSLAAGTYFVGLKEFTTVNNIGLAYTDDNYTPHKVWVQINADPFDTLEAYGFKGSFIIEPYLVCASFMTNITATNDTVCSGTSTTLTASNGTIYNWNTGGATSAITVSPTTTTTYTVTVTNKYGCTDTDNFTVTVNTAPAAYQLTGGGSYCAGGTGVAVGLASSQAGVNYQLQANSVNTGSPVPGTGNAISFGNQVSAGTYTVIATNATTSCTATMTGSVTVTIITVTATATANPTSVCLGSCTDITANPSGGSAPYTYLWNTGAAIQTNNVCPVSNTTYTVTVISSDGCSATASVTVIVNPSPTADAGSNVTICAGSNTQLTATGGTAYAWSPSTGLSATNIANPMASPTTTTAYTVTVTSGGCTATDVVTVTVNASPVADAGTDQSIPTGTSTTLNGSATGGTPAYTFLWAPAGDLVAANVQNPTTNNLTTTTVFTVTVTDQNGCSGTDQITVTVTGGTLNVTCPTITGIACPGNCTVLNALVSGGSSPYSYLWSAVPVDASLTGHETETGPTVCPTVTTTYTLNITDNTAGTASCSFVITVDTPMSTDTVVVPETCGNTDGTATVNVTGGTSAYSYIWNTVPPQTTQTATGLAAGTYSVTITDAAGCTTATSAVVNCIVGIDETANTANISIAPNPSDGSFNMTITGFEGKDATLVICNLIGQTLYSENLSVTTDVYSERINLQDISKGVYLIKVVTNSSVRTVRLVIE